MKQTRIDLVLVKEGLRNFMKDIKYVFTTFSDHAGLTFSVGLVKERGWNMVYECRVFR